MPDDPITAALAPIRERAANDRMRTPNITVRRLLAGYDKVLTLHASRTDHVYGRSCVTHRPLHPVPGCLLCTPDSQREVCPECRDEYGDPVLFGDCRVRAAIAAALTGGENG